MAPTVATRRATAVASGANPATVVFAAAGAVAAAATAVAPPTATAVGRVPDELVGCPVVVHPARARAMPNWVTNNNAGRDMLLNKQDQCQASYANPARRSRVRQGPPQVLDIHRS